MSAHYQLTDEYLYKQEAFPETNEGVTRPNKRPPRRQRRRHLGSVVHLGNPWLQITVIVCDE